MSEPKAERRHVPGLGGASAPEKAGVLRGAPAMGEPKAERRTGAAMRALDVVAALLVGIAVVAFGVGNAALARAEDVHALYWLVVGVVSLRAGVQLARPGAS